MDQATAAQSASGRSDSETLHWIALRLTPGLGARKTLDLLEAYRSPMAIFRAPVSELCGCGLSRQVAQSVASGCCFDDAARQHERIKQAGARLITIRDETYPEVLRQIFDPPPILFALGRHELLNRVSVAIVGTRRPTAYGEAVAERFGGDLAAAGVVVASGMARGIDTAAHKGALQAGGPTIAVFGCGADVVYPVENRKLAEQIAREGLIVSEFPMGSPAYPQNFPVRNRVVSGLSAGVVVVEGAEFSGSSITARLALDQGREVFAVPGPITSENSVGPHLLLKQGAHLAQSAGDILDALPWEARRKLVADGPRIEAREPQREDLGLTALASQLIDLIKVDKPIPLDVLVDACIDFSSSEVIAELFDLEMRGLIRQLPGKTFVKVWT